jgi:cytochrome c5
LGQGLSGLLHSVINGKGAMQARAGSSPDDYSDYELARAVVYMANASGGNLAEPNIPVVPSAQNKPNAENTVPNTNISSPNTDNNSIDKKEETTAKPSTNTEINTTETGKKVFEQACIACHGSGVAGAPKLGDKAAWANRISVGKDALYQSAAKGKGAMPPRGGFAGSDEEFKAAIDYMLASVK